jgi:hypothetical protein
VRQSGILGGFALGFVRDNTVRKLAFCDVRCVKVG